MQDCVCRHVPLRARETKLSKHAKWPHRSRFAGYGDLPFLTRPTSGLPTMRRCGIFSLYPAPSRRIAQHLVLRGSSRNRVPNLATSRTESLVLTFALGLIPPPRMPACPADRKSQSKFDGARMTMLRAVWL